MRRIIVIIGGPCVGKSTLSRELTLGGDFVKISFGDLLDELISASSSESEPGIKLDRLQDNLRHLTSRPDLHDSAVHLLPAGESAVGRTRHPSFLAEDLVEFFPLFEEAMIELIVRYSERSSVCKF